MKNFVSTHWGTYETSKKNGKNIKINKWSKDPNPSDFGLGFIKSATDGTSGGENITVADGDLVIVQDVTDGTVKYVAASQLPGASGSGVKAHFSFPIQLSQPFISEAR